MKNQNYFGSRFQIPVKFKNALYNQMKFFLIIIQSVLIKLFPLLIYQINLLLCVLPKIQ